MKFSEMIQQASDLLQQRGRRSYRTLRLEFDLDEEQLDVLKEQLIDIEALAVDQDGKMLVWARAAPASSFEFQVPSSKSENQKPETGNEKLSVSSQPPIAYTPPHLAERIRAEQAALEARGATDGERRRLPRCLPISKARRRCSKVCHERSTECWAMLWER